MADVKKVIDEILSGTKFKNGAFFTDRVYTDMPILRTASQLSGYLPEPCRKMRELARDPETLRHNEEWLFVKQGRMMADYEDDFLYNGDFFRYYPTYQSMNDAQLRYYFSWRAAVRRGVIEKTSLSFVFVYLYELLNLIGVASPEEGFEKLQSFWSRYRVLDPYIDRYLSVWLSDYCIYYNLPCDALPLSPEECLETALSVLSSKEAPDAARFDALNTLSSYRIGKSKFYREHGDDVQAVALRVFRRWEERFEKSRKNTLIEHLFGHICELSYPIFSSAVFYDERRYQDYTYRKNGLRVYRCRNGYWTCRRLYGNLTRNTDLGDVLHTVDRLLREHYSYPAPLAPRPLGKWLTGVIEKEILAHFAEKKEKEKEKEKEKPKIELDLSKLAGIRLAADHTREKLIVNEEEEDGIPASLCFEQKRPAAPAPVFTPASSPVSSPASSPVSAPASSPVSAPASSPVSAPAFSPVSAPAFSPVSAPASSPAFGAEQSSASSLPAPYSSLTPDELFLLRALIGGTPYREALREKGVMPSLLADSVNEKLMDEFSDTVLITENDLPVLLDDYREELKERLKL